MALGGFRKVLSFWDIFWLGIGGMVGVAILTFPSMTYGYAGPSALVGWILAGIFSILMAIVYAEMVTAFPKSGALVVFPYEAFGKGRLARYLAFLEGIGYYIGTLFGIIVSAIILGEYISPWFGTGIGLIVAAEASLVFVGAVNILGAKMTSRANKIMSIIFTALFGVVIAVGLWFGHASNLIPFVSGANGLVGIIYTIPVAILAYGAWTAIIAVPEETKNVRDIPKALIYSLGIVTLLYALLVLVTYMNLSASQLAPSGSFYYYPVYGLVAGFGNSIFTILFQIAAVLSIVAVMVVMVMANARINYALGKLDFLPQKLNKMSSHSIPLYATLLAVAIPMLLSLFPSEYYQYVIIGAIIGTGIPRIIDLAAYIKIRNKSSYKPTFKVKYGIAIAVIAFAGLVISEIGIGISDVFWSVASFIAITLAFFVVEKFIAGRRTAAASTA